MDAIVPKAAAEWVQVVLRYFMLSVPINQPSRYFRLRQ